MSSVAARRSRRERSWIDVYKRQAVQHGAHFFGGDHGDIVDGAVGNHGAAGRYGVDAVSYTHLDVYKRQTQSRRLRD